MPKGLRKVVETGEPWRDDDAIFQLHNGRTLVVGYACSALVEEGIRKGIIISFRDINSLKRAQQELAAGVETGQCRSTGGRDRP